MSPASPPVAALGPASAGPAAGVAQRRADIQVLRAVAVAGGGFSSTPGCCLLAFSASTSCFALSGFLMTRLIAAEMGNGTFRLRDFYLRRARRLLPAALTTLAVTTALAPFLLTPTDYGAFRADLLGALTFSANIVLWLQTDYFAAAAETKPLLHMWSLSLEEQFFLLLPLVLLLAPRRWWGVLVAVATVASAGLALALLSGAIDLPVSYKRVASGVFYLLPTRAFEFLAGVAAALAVARWGPLALPRAAGRLCLIALFLLLTVPLGPFHPGPAALLVVLLTALLCAGDGRWCARDGPAAPLTRLGDWSYSVYLVHWPLLAYANSAFLGETPLALRGGLLVAAIVLGAMQYRLVEEPLRRGGGPLSARRAGTALAGATLGCALFGVAVIGPLERGFPQRLPPNLGLATVCDQRGAVVVDHAACRTRRSPRVALLGDSYAMQWAAALAAQETEFGGLVQITQSGCDPAAAAGLPGPPYRPRDPAERRCAAFMADAADKIAASPGIGVVVISSSWAQARRHAAAAGSGSDRLAPFIAATAERFLHDGKTVLLLAPAPSSGRDVATCHARRTAHRPLPSNRDCTIATRHDTQRHGPVYTALRAASRHTDVAVVWPAQSLCAQSRCRTALGQTPLYADRDHLTLFGAAHVARSLKLAQTIAAHRPPRATGSASTR
ncbi:MAG: acyltransferase family protein [Acuticoccus sp.]